MSRSNRKNESSLLNPVAENERMHILDALRGFAILGIFFVNLIYFSGYKYLAVEDIPGYGFATSDYYGSFLIELLAHGKFYSLFSFLFGLGFAIQLDRTSRKGLSFLPLYMRRLFILFLIGLLHTFLIWQGDILTVYAIAALLLIPFRNLSNRIIITAAILLIMSPIFFYAFMMQTGVILGNDLAMLGIELTDKWNIPDSDIVFTSGGFKAFFISKIPNTLFRYSNLLFDSRFPKLWGLFLIGFYFGRNKIFTNPAAYKSLFKKIFIYCGIVGLSLNLIGTLYKEQLSAYPISEKGLYATILEVFGVHPLAMAYMAGFTLLYISFRKNNVLDWMAPVGRMALTNYLMQSVIGVFVFYNVGLGLGPVGPTVFIPFAFLIFFIQVQVSRWWLSQFKYGPVEWLWRNGIYGKIQPIKKAQ